MISIITIVKNDRGIENTLKHLSKIPKPCDCETIVIDASEGNIDDIKEKFPAVRWIYYHNNTGKKITIPEQRNLGVRSAKGNIIVFIDANCIPVKNWLVELYKTHKKFGDDIVCGPVLPNKNNVINNIGETENKSVHRLECPSTNILINKKVYNKVGFYDEKLEYGEDTDFTWRSVAAGFKIRFNEKAGITHDWGNLYDEFRRSFRYGYWRAVVILKHNYMWKNIIIINYRLLCYTLFVLFLPVSIFYPAYLTILLIPLIISIRKMNIRQSIKLQIINLINGYGFINGVVSRIFTTNYSFWSFYQK